MKTILTSSLARSAAFAAALFVLPVIASAKDSAPADRAAQLLALHGSVAVQNAGPHVEIGTFQIQVAVKLGRPSARLADGSWLYSGLPIENSQADGLLVVRFTDRRVSALSYVTPTVATALRDAKTADQRILVAGNK